MTFNSEDEKKQFMTEVIDKLLYCPGFKEELQQLMTKHQVPTERKVSHKAMDFNYDKKHE
jgi:hypothetical protein